MPPQPFTAHCVEHLKIGGSCDLTRERSDLMKPTPTTDPQSLDPAEVRAALAKLIHTDDLDTAVRRIVKPWWNRSREEEVKVRPNPRTCHGKSILEMIWDDLDATVERLMSVEPEDADEIDVGQARGLAFAIAVIVNPYYPNIETVREQAMGRWAAEHGEE